MKNFMKKHKLQVNNKKLLAKGKRVLALLLAVAMVTGTLPASTAYAAEETTEATTEAADVAVESTEVDESVLAAEDGGTTDGSEVGEPAEIILGDLIYLDGDYDVTGGDVADPWAVDQVNGNWIVSIKYDEAVANPFETLVKNLKEGSYVRVETEDSENDADLKSLLKYQWQQKAADGSYADMAEGAVPNVTGEYKLVISIDKKFADAEPVSIDFIIEKKELYVTYDESLFNEVMDSGNTVKEVKEALAEAWGLADAADEEAVPRYKVFANDPVITVKESFGTTALADETVLLKGGDYSVWISVAVKEQHQANYEIIQRDMINLRIVELVDTKIEITNNRLGEGADLIRHYNGQAVADPTVGGEDAEITVVVKAEDVDPVTGEKIWVDLTPAEGALTFHWQDADGAALESAPTEAGAYYYRAVYSDANGIYKRATSRIRVIVEPKTLILKPEYASENKVYAGSSAKNILSQVGYKLFAKDDNVEFSDFDKETFWGVSYNNPEKVQSYSPVFALQEGLTITETVDGKEQTNTTWTNVDVAQYRTGEKIKVEDKEATVSYRIIFTGKKGLFEGGVATDAINVNTVVNHTDTNYVIDITALEANALAIQIMANENAEIDVTAILKDGKGKTFDDAYTKIFDGEPLYADRAEYKKAVVKALSTNTAIAQNTDAELSYVWRYYSVVDKKDENGEVIKDKDGNPEREAVHGEEVYTLYNGLPREAGKYVLEVIYTDPSNQYAAKPAYVYFDIQKQLVKSVISGEPVAYTGTTVRQFKSVCPEMMAHKLYLVPGNDTTLTDDKLVELTEVMEINKLYPIYYLNWVVEVGDHTDKAQAKFETASNSTVFAERLHYKVHAEVNFYENNYYYGSEVYDNFTNNYEVVEDGETVVKSFGNELDINVKKMGETKLAVRIDEDKRGVYEKIYDGTGFDLTEAIKAGYITLVEENTDKVVPIIGDGALDVQFTWESYNEYRDRDQEATGIVSPANAREYTLYISFAGNDTYQSFGMTTIGTYVIEERDLVITPAIQENIKAGLKVGESNFFNSVVDTSKTAVTGYIAADAEAFGNGLLSNAMGLVFRNRYYSAVYDANNDAYTSYLRTGKTYGIEVSVKFIADDYSIWERYIDNYNIVAMRAMFSPNVRGNSKVVKTNNGYIEDQVNGYFNVEYAPGVVDVTPLTAIPYETDIVDIEGRKLPEGNYFELFIQAPDEFKAEGYLANFERHVFKNHVEAAGGYVTGMYESQGMFSAVFPVEDKADKSFVILWEEGYTETYNLYLSKAELMVDVRKAVAPKSLAFNGTNKKMYVGETQQLDVKIGRVLSTDVVLLNYQVLAGNDVLSVDYETGVVTALKVGSATVEVYPVKVVDGVYQRIDSFKKSVTVKITVANVTAPKILNVKATDSRMDMEYKVPADGYRREVYVLPGKGLKASDFENKIAANGNAEFSYRWTYEDDKYFANEAYGIYCNGLQPNTDYTVYVRNVSAIRETADGQEVAASASGSVKSFKTTKRQIDSLDLRLAQASKETVVYDELDGRYEVPLSAKSFNIETWLLYAYKDSQEAAENWDGIEMLYPISKADQNTYLNPKMEYFIIDADDYYNDYSFVKTSEYKYPLREVIDEETYTYVDRYYKASKLATIDKKGVVKLKGIGDILVCGRDTISNKNDVFGLVNIYADVTKMSAKKLTLKEGSAVDLYDYLVFNDNKTKLTGIEGLREQHPIVVTTSDADAVEYANGYLCAVQPNKKVTLTISLAYNPSVSTTMQVTTKEMDAVKSLKVYDITDVDAQVSFTHTGNVQNYPYFDGETKFKVTIKDNRGSIVESYIVEDGDGDLDLIESKSNYKKNNYFYVLDMDRYELYRQSSYTVSIAPLFRDSLGKAASKKFKTTNIPASYENLGKNVYGGEWIYEEDEVALDQAYFISGNTYTLCIGGDWNSGVRKSDKLTWKSTNKKVASIKANTGTFTATLKALKPGVTDIEVVSKITKKVIARHSLVVIPVGNGVGAYGSWEPVNFEDIEAKNGVEPLTLENPARFYKATDAAFIDHRDYFFATFTAPFDGEFNFALNSKAGHVQFVSGSYGNGTVKMNQGETIKLTMMAQFAKYNTSALRNERGNNHVIDFDLSVSATKSYNTLILGSSVNSQEGNSIRFVAPADNYYTFCATLPNMRAVVSANGKSNNIVLYNEKNGNTGLKSGVGLKKGDIATVTLNNVISTYDVSVKGRVASVLTTTDAGTAVEVTKGNEKWFSFTAPVAGNYTFASTEANEELKADYYSSIMNADKSFTLTQLKDDSGIDTNNFNQTINLDKDALVLLCVYTDKDDVTVKAKVNVSQPIVKTVSTTQPLTVSIGKDDEVWVGFEVPEGDTEYCFDYVVKETEEDKTKTYTVNRNYFLNSVVNRATVNNDRVSGYKRLKKGDMIYVQLTAKAPEGADYADKPATVVVSVNATTATALEVGKSVDLTAEDNGMYYYSFKAPSYGLYTFASEVEEVKDVTVHSLNAAIYTAADWNTYENSFGKKDGSDFRAERVLATGEEIIFAVAANSLDGIEKKVEQTAAKIVVNKVEPAVITAETQNIPAETSKWFKYTATYDDSYVISWEDTAAKVYYSASLNPYMEDGNDSELISGSTHKLLSGETLYIKVINSSEKETGIKFNVASTTPELPNKGVNMDKGDVNTYKYLVSKEGRYKISITFAAEDQSATVYGNGRYYNNGDEFYATVGQTLLFEVTADTDVNVTIKLELITPAALTANAVKLTAGESKWFEYTIPASGRYNAKLTDAEDKETAVTATYLIDEMKGDPVSLSNMNGNWFNQGQVIYVKMANDTAEDLNAKTVISQISMKDITINAEELTATVLKSGDEKWFRFRADEDAYYTFTAEKDSNVSVRYYINASNSNRNLNSGTWFVQKNTWYDIKVTRPANDGDDEKVSKLGVDKEVFVSLKEKTDNAITAKAGETVYAKFDVPATDYYSIVAKELPEGVTVEFTTRGGNTVDYNANSLYNQDSYKIGTTEYYAIKVNFEADAEKPDETKTVKLYIDRIVPAELTDSVELTVSKGLRSWFKFTAPEDGRYSFTDSSKLVNVKCYVCKGAINDNPSMITLPEEYTMYEGDVLYMAAYYDSTKDGSDLPPSATFTVSVKKAEAKPITSNKFNDKIAANSTSWYSFTANSVEAYSFAFKKVTGTGDAEVADSYVVGVYSDMMNSYSYNNTSTFSDFMAVDDVWYFCVKNSSSEEMNFRVEISTPAKQRLSLTDSTVVNFEEYGTKWMEAELSQSGYYTIKRSDNGSVGTMQMYNSSADSIYYSYGTDYDVLWLDAGRYLMEVYGYTNGSTTVELRKVRTISSNQQIDVEVDENGITYVECIMANSCFPSVSRVDGVNAPSRVTLTHRNGGSLTVNANATSTDNNRLYAKGSSALITVRGSQGASTSLVVAGSADYMLLDGGSIAVGARNYVELAEHTAICYTFTAPADGTYRIWSEDKYNDPYVQVYDAKGNQIGSNDDSGSLNFSYSRTFKQGETVQYIARNLGWRAEKMTICFEKVN